MAMIRPFIGGINRLDVLMTKQFRDRLCNTGRCPAGCWAVHVILPAALLHDLWNIQAEFYRLVALKARVNASIRIKYRSKTIQGAPK